MRSGEKGLRSGWKGFVSYIIKEKGIQKSGGPKEERFRARVFLSSPPRGKSQNNTRGELNHRDLLHFCGVKRDEGTPHCRSSSRAPQFETGQAGNAKEISEPYFHRRLPGFHVRRVFILHRIFSSPRAPYVGVSCRRVVSGFHFGVSFLRLISGRLTLRKPNVKEGSR